MQQLFKDVEVLSGTVLPDFNTVFQARPFKPFSGEVMSFLQAVSEKLMRMPACRAFPDVVSFAFWCRKGSLESMKGRYDDEGRLGRGVVYHISPSNVPVNFAYSLAASLLAGNISIVRVPSKPFAQVDMLCAVIRDTLEVPQFEPLRSHVVLLRYERSEEANCYFSQNCDVRIIWGGDSAITEIRKAVLPARSFDMTFADRYSLCVIDAGQYLQNADPAALAAHFYNDTYLSDQNACTSPHLVVWLGEPSDVAAAKRVFWDTLHVIVKEKYELSAIWSVDKYTKFLELALEQDAQLAPMPDQFILRAQMAALTPNIDEYRGATGFFTEYDAHGLSEIATIVSRKYQTLSYYGVPKETLSEWVSSHRLCGVDRIVPIGKTMDFSLTWDGYDLIKTLSRKYTVE